MLQIWKINSIFNNVKLAGNLINIDNFNYFLTFKDLRMNF